MKVTAPGDLESPEQETGPNDEPVAEFDGFQDVTGLRF